MSNLFKHIKLVATHRRYVRNNCFKMGLYWQGLVHDLSKYSLTELSISKYYSGTRSPHENCREAIGYSPSWMHHYHNNKHHFQYFWDEDENGNIIPIKMPYKYVIESLCDMVGAGKAYNKDKWNIHQPYKYYIDKCKDKRIMNKESEELLVLLLKQLDSSESEKEFYNWYKQNKKKLKQEYNNK